jgi:opacity protein-like surface antigen
MKRITLGCLGLLSFFTLDLYGQRLEISPFYGYGFGGEVVNAATNGFYQGVKYSLHAGPAYGLFIDFGLPETEKVKKNFELRWSHQDSVMDLQGYSGLNDVNLGIDQIQIGGSVERADAKLREYLSLLVGATHYSTDGYGSTTKFSFSFGVGLKYFPCRNVALRADLRAFCTVVEGEGAFISTGGTTIVAFSGTTFWQGQATVGVSIAF